MKLTKGMTVDQIYAPAMEITGQSEADDYLAAIVCHLVEDWGKSIAEASQIAKKNLAYYAGYYDSETRERVERLFQCEHPVLGSIAEKGIPTFEEAFNIGVQMGREMKASQEVQS